MISERQFAMIERASQRGVAFGETLGFEVPTQYGAEVHTNVNTLLAADALITPALLGMGWRTVWTCRLLAALLMMTGSEQMDMERRHRLQVEAVTGILLLVMAVRGDVSRHMLDRVQLATEGIVILGNCLMTRVD